MKKSYSILAALMLFLILSINAQDTLYIDLAPGKGMDVESSSISPDQNYEPRFFMTAYAWTIGGQLNISRAFLQFDMTSIPSNLVIQEAKLFLFGTTLQNHSGTNTSLVTRITEPWLSTTLTHNNQPAVTSLGSAVIPTTTASYQDIVVDVTAMTQYMISNPNERYGYRISLIDESIYKILAFWCSEASDPTKRPMLMLVSTNTGVDDLSINSNITISPNPVANQLTINGFNDGTTLAVQIYSMIGQLVYTDNQFDASQSLDVSSIENGFYILKITNNGETISKKILIQK